MPRGVKGSGKARKPAKAAVKPEKKARKPYPTHEERLAAVNQDIERLTKLNEERVALVAKTEEKLAERKTALARSEEALLKAQAKKEKIVSVMNRPPKAPAEKLSPEERAEKRKAALAKAREAKKAEKEKLNALMAAIEQSGKSVDEVLAGLNA